MPPQVCIEVQILHISFLLGGTPEIKHCLLNLLPRNRFPHAVFPWKEISKYLVSLSVWKLEAHGLELHLASL